MKLTTIAGALVAVTTLGVSLAVTTPDVAQAKAKSSLAAVPQSLRGTWYHYQEANGYFYESLNLGAKKMTVRNAYDAYGRKHAKKTYTLHVAKDVNKITNGDYITKKTANWMYAATRKNGYTEVGNWNFGFNSVGYGNYKVGHQTYKGKSVKVLTNKTNYGFTDHFYQTKAQAKFFNPVGALHK